jgi:hypothetical protein
MHSLLFGSFLFCVTLATDCKSHKDEKTCAADHGCIWCQAWAIPSACFTEEDAKGLSDAVFECHWPKVLLDA